MALFRMAFFRLFALVFRHFAWRISFFRLFAWRYFVFSLFRLALFRLFAWRYFVLAPRHNARRKDEITKWHKQATIFAIDLFIETLVGSFNMKVD